MSVPEYAELHCVSNFSFLRGASSAQELFERAKALGYRALAITDEASMAGIVRAYEASRKTGVPLIVGSEIALEKGPALVLLAQTLAGYQTLCRWITLGRRRAAKGGYRLARAAGRIKLIEVVAPFEGQRVQGGCLLRPGRPCSRRRADPSRDAGGAGRHRPRRPRRG